MAETFIESTNLFIANSSFFFQIIFLMIVFDEIWIFIEGPLKIARVPQVDEVFMCLEFEQKYTRCDMKF